MAEVFYRGVHQIADEYAGDASRIWAGSPSCDTVRRRFLSVHGAGPKIASMAVNILVRDLKVPLTDRRSLDVALDVHTRRVLKRTGLVPAGAEDSEMLQAARLIGPDYPGLLDLPLWEIGRETCHEVGPGCRRCRLGKHCPSAGRRRGG
jgi:endonuclease-3